MPQFKSVSPETLYKYRSTDTLERDLETLFARRSLYLATPLSLNDPFDCRPVFSVPNDPDFESTLIQHELLFPPEERGEARRRAHVLKRSPRARRAFADEHYPVIFTRTS